MGDGFVNEWPASLDGLKALGFDVIVPGHGAPLRDRSQIDDLQAYLRDLWAQASKLRAEGLSADEGGRPHRPERARGRLRRARAKRGPAGGGADLRGAPASGTRCKGDR